MSTKYVTFLCCICWSFPSHELPIHSAGEFCPSARDVIYFAHALVTYRTLPMYVRILTQKSEEATASPASLPLGVVNTLVFTYNRP